MTTILDREGTQLCKVDPIFSYTENQLRQFARLSGYTLIAICSPHNFGLVRQMGAEAVFDYADREEAANYIREYTNKMLTLAWDTVSIPWSARFCGQALSSKGSCRYAALLPVNCPRTDVTSSHTMAYTVLGEDGSSAEAGIRPY